MLYTTDSCRAFSQQSFSDYFGDGGKTLLVLFDDGDRIGWARKLTYHKQMESHILQDEKSSRSKVHLCAWG